MYIYANAVYLEVCKGFYLSYQKLQICKISKK
jgi:hypothetical protein